MKKGILILAAFLGMFSFANAQKFAYLDSDYVLQHMPEYASAQAELNRLSDKWEKEIAQKYENIRKMEEAFAAEKILLPEEMQKKRKDAIELKRQEAMDLQRKRFGVGGDLFQKREELIKPVQDKMFEAIQKICSVKGYMVVFDKSNKSNMLYTNPKYDISDKVVKEMGYKPGETIDGEDGKNNKKDEGQGKGKGSNEKGDTKSNSSRPSGSNMKGNTVKPR